MFRARSISARLILAVAAIVAVNCSVLGIFSIAQERSLTRLALDQQLKQQYDGVMAAIEYEGRAARAVSGTVAAIPPVADAIARGDRASLIALLAGAMDTIKAQGIALLTVHTPSAVVFLRLHDPKAFGDDISARRPNLLVANRTGEAVVGVEPARDALSIFAASPVMRDGKSLGDVDAGITFGKDFVDRAKRRFNVDLAVHVPVGAGFNTLTSTSANGAIATPEELKAAFNGTALHRDATFDGHPATIYLGQIKNYAGQPVAVIELIKDTTEYDAAAVSGRWTLIFGTIVIIGVGIVLALALGRSLSRPLTAITATMHRLSTGDTTVAIPGSERPDELGTMAKAIANTLWRAFV